MPRKPGFSGKEIIRALRQNGFEVIRIKRSHHFLRHSDGRCTVVPVHPGEMLGVGLMGKILKDADVSAEDLMS
jgi:predicted RNA binding protein YcfA (HicA-like mRNA interferase family)